ncbi:hypothetical protein IWX84_001727 [Flavobacterium sp. CG_9.10]|nr:hypothetical protein [Flavobacterium sp. CG_9.10]
MEILFISLSKRDEKIAMESGTTAVVKRGFVLLIIKDGK